MRCGLAFGCALVLGVTLALHARYVLAPTIRWLFSRGDA